MISERVITISEKRLEEIKESLIDDAWEGSANNDPEGVQAYLEDFADMIIKEGLKED